MSVLLPTARFFKPRTTLCTSCRSIKKITRIEDPYANRKDPIADYLPKKVTARRQAYGWGLAVSGAIGNRTFLEPNNLKYPFAKPRIEQNRPSKVRFFKDFTVVDVAAGYGFSLFAVKSSKAKNHSIYGTGINTYNQIGWQESSGKRLTVLIEPVPIHLPLHVNQTIDKVAAGRCHSLVLANPGHEVFSFGSNAFGQLGRNIIEAEDYSKSCFIRRIPLPEPIVDIVCGQDHSLFLSNSGAVYACGLGADGQTGLGHFQNQGEPERVGGDLEGEKIIQVSACADSNLAISDKGDLFGWGNSEYLQFKNVTDDKQLNVPKRLPIDAAIGKVIRVAAGGSACLILNERNEIYVWGFGFLGKGPEIDHLKDPSLIPKTLFHCDEFSPDRKIVDIAAGLRHFAAISNQGDLFMWGKNRNGCLGLYSGQDNQFFPIRVQTTADVLKVSLGVDHTLALCKSSI